MEDSTVKEAEQPSSSADAEVILNAEGTSDAAETPPLSKNQQKKALKRKLDKERWEAGKKERRFNEKSKRKLKKVAEREKMAEERKALGIEEPFQEEMTEEEKEARRQNRGVRKKQEEVDYKEQCNANFGIVIDCKWEDVHDENGLKSLMKQVIHAYAVNRKFSRPSHLYLTGVGPYLYERLMKLGADHWLAATIIKDDDYITVPNFQTDSVVNGDSDSVDKKKQLVYLTSDAEETIEELDSNCAYIIGGIVDRNSLKGITLKKAEEQNIRTVKLPIRDHLHLTKTHVLTVNHCVELLLHKGSGASSVHWKEALETVLPVRKMSDKKRKRGGGEGGESISSGRVDEEDGDLDLAEGAEGDEGDEGEEEGAKEIVKSSS